MRTRALLATKPGCIGVEEIEVPAPGRGEVLVETIYSVVSPGTELRCLIGQQPGDTKWPFIPGYSIAGRVVARGEGATLAEGTLVYCSGTRRASVAAMWGGQTAHAVLPQADAFVVPEGVKPLDAAFAHIAAIGRRGVCVAAPKVGNTVAVFGLGPIGQMSARLFKEAGARVLAMDMSPDRVDLAKSAGISARVPQAQLAAEVEAEFGEGTDIVVDATGSVVVFGQAVAAAKQKPWGDTDVPSPRIVIQGSYPGDLPIPYQAAFEKEAILLLPRDGQPSDVRFVLDAMSRGRLQVADLASEILSPSAAQDAYDRLLARTPGLMTVAFDWSQ